MPLAIKIIFLIFLILLTSHIEYLDFVTRGLIVP